MYNICVCIYIYICISLSLSISVDPQQPADIQPAALTVERSAESMQQSVRLSTWCENNQATHLLTPPVPNRLNDAYNCRLIGRVETMLAEAMLADLRARAARVCWRMCTGCTTEKVPLKTYVSHCSSLNYYNIYIYIFVCVSLSLCIYIYIYICVTNNTIYIYIYTYRYIHVK